MLYYDRTDIRKGSYPIKSNTKRMHDLTLLVF